jgi:putative DNA primase/helicase
LQETIFAAVESYYKYLDRHGLFYDDEREQLRATALIVTCDALGDMEIVLKDGAKDRRVRAAECSTENVIAWLKDRGLWQKPERRPPPRNPQPVQEEAAPQIDRRRIAYSMLRTAVIANDNGRRDNRLPYGRRQQVSGGRENLLAYFNGRGIEQVPPNTMYLSRELSYKLAQLYPESGLPRGAPGFPAMIQPTRDAQGHLRGALLTVLTSDSKANLKMDGKSVRRIVGASKHAFVQVSGEFNRDRPLLVAEGGEKAAAVVQRLLREEDYPAIATLGTENMGGSMALPLCAEVWIAADNGDSGSKAAKSMAGHVKRSGGTARIVFPPEQFKDWDEAIKAADPETLARYREAFLSAPPFDDEVDTADDDTSRLAPTVAEVLTMEIPPLDYLMEPWLTTSSVGELHAQRGVGKTRFAMAVAQALASGQDFLRWKVKRPVRVLYVDGELPGALLQKRLQLLGPPSPNLRVVSRDLLLRQNVVLPDLGSEEGRAFLDRVIAQQQSEVVILDSLSTLIHSGAENEAESWAPVQAWLLALRFRGVAVIFIAHEGHQRGRARGTSKREDTLDFTLGLELKDGDITAEQSTEVSFVLNFTKKRELNGRDAAPLLLHLSTAASGSSVRRWEFVGERARQQIKDLQKQGLKQKQIAKEVGLSQSQVSRILRSKVIDLTEVLKRRDQKLKAKVTATDPEATDPEATDSEEDEDD